MTENAKFIIDAMLSMFRMEIENIISFKDNEIVVVLNDLTFAKISTKNVV